MFVGSGICPWFGKRNSGSMQPKFRSRSPATLANGFSATTAWYCLCSNGGQRLVCDRILPEGLLPLISVLERTLVSCTIVVRYQTATRPWKRVFNRMQNRDSTEGDMRNDEISRKAMICPNICKPLGNGHRRGSLHYHTLFSSFEANQPFRGQHKAFTNSTRRRLVRVHRWPVCRPTSSYHRMRRP